MKVITVTKRPIDGFVYDITLDGKVHTLTLKEAELLYDELRHILDKPWTPDVEDCGDRFSHSAHLYGQSGQRVKMCSGRSTDVT